MSARCPTDRARIDFLVERALGGILFTGSFDAALRAAIRHRGLTLDRLRWHLARRGVVIGLSSLSDWQNGRSRPGQANSLRAVWALEDVLRLPPGSLVRLLDRTGSGRLTDIGPVAELLDTLPGARDRGVELISVQNSVAVGAERRIVLQSTRIAVRARRDGVDRYVVRYYGNPGCVAALVEPQPVGNCRLGAVRAHPTAPALVYELLFDEVLRAGDTWVFESALVDRTGGTCTEFAYGFRYPAEQYQLQVRFDPAARPARCWSFGQFDLTDERHPTGDLPITRYHDVHLVASAIDSGVLGIKWDWEL
ncbi:MAG TPA: hypothetical protein VGX25_32530 [Actinophytocola sp.]|uniref:hypothetical protein n=1 Tax=Actinophytocola sp. TaxID=1872138 RepID=UPI002DDCCCF9|nr:hypothetical protein [Actinophytocola sp.]HEV2784138.1 hypothetical protein [Actinophytocola sp.]